MSIHRLLIIMMLTVSMAGMLLFHTVYGNWTRTAFTQLDLQIIMQSVEQSRDKLDVLLESMENRCAYMAASIQPGELDSEDFRYTASGLLAMESELDAILLFDEAGRLLMGEGRSPLRSDYQAKDEAWFVQLDTTALSYSRPHIQQAGIGTYTWVVSLTKPIHFFRGGQDRAGFLCLDISLSALKSICDSSTLGTYGYLHITDSLGMDIYTPRQKLSGLTGLGDIYRGIGAMDAEYRQLEISQPCRNGTWNMMGVIWESQVSQNSSVLYIRSIWLLLASIGLSFLLASLSAHYIVRPILAMEKTMGQMNRTTQEARLRPTGTKEFISLSVHYNAMLDRIDQLMAESSDKQDQLWKMELATLQDQIKPHFLYNTLESIVWILETGRNQEAIRMIEALAKLLRLSMNKGGNFHKVSHEVDHVTNYMIIQSIRLGQKMRWALEMEPGAGDLLCPKIILQPIVENAIKYGIGNSGSGTLSVRIWLEGDFLKMAVRDDGMGIPPLMLLDLRQQMDNTAEQEAPGGIGMRNVNRRIKLLHGPAYGISIDSETEEWTCVTLSLPIIHGP